MVSPKSVSDNLKQNTLSKRCLIVGCGVAGRELLDQLLFYKSLGFTVVGFVDDNPLKQGKRVKKIPVLGKIEQLEKLISEYAIATVFVAIPSAQGSLIRIIVECCQKAKISFRIVPRTLEIIQGRVYLEHLRSVSLGDILGRAILKSDQLALKKVFRNKVILVTGAAGSIGAELSRQLAKFSPKLLILLDWWENGLFELGQELDNFDDHVRKRIVVGNIQDRKKMEWVFQKFNPQIIFHAAAFKHVPLMEENPEEAVKDNIIGTKICAELAGQHQSERFIFISTDKAVSPTSVMGATKSFAELVVRYLNKKFSTKYSSVRFGNVMGSNGSVVPIFEKQIASGGPVTITHPEMVRYFMSIPEAVQLILQAGKLGKGGEIFVLDMGEPVKIVDLAKIMIRLAGFEPEQDIPIKIVGVRPGEKIMEEVLTKEEEIKKTEHKLIYVTKNVLKIKDRDLITSMERLINMADAADRRGITKEIRRLLPAYRQKKRPVRLSKLIAPKREKLNQKKESKFAFT